MAIFVATNIWLFGMLVALVLVLFHKVRLSISVFIGSFTIITLAFIFEDGIQGAATPLVVLGVGIAGAFFFGLGRLFKSN
jgi:hypothetical protein